MILSISKLTIRPLIIKLKILIYTWPNGLLKKQKLLTITLLIINIFKKISRVHCAVFIANVSSMNYFICFRNVLSLVFLSRL